MIMNLAMAAGGGGGRGVPPDKAGRQGAAGATRGVRTLARGAGRVEGVRRLPDDARA